MQDRLRQVAALERAAASFARRDFRDLPPRSEADDESMLAGFVTGFVTGTWLWLTLLFLAWLGD